jgi:hypothetical protein
MGSKGNFVGVRKKAKLSYQQILFWGLLELKVWFIGFKVNFNSENNNGQL